MTHILDNPIRNALDTGNQHLAEGNACAKYFKRTVSAFAGMKDNSSGDFECLYAVSEFDSPVVLFTPGEIAIPVNWRVEFQKEITQMVYVKTISPSGVDTPISPSGVDAPISPGGLAGSIVPLSDKDIPAMMALADLTKPGPFLSRTIDFGNYIGIFDGPELVAMAGQRMQPDPYTEISAVCTHPDHTGKGYAGALIRSQIQRILGASRIPFLHVFPENPALQLYRKLGFEARRDVRVYVLQKK